MTSHEVINNIPEAPYIPAVCNIVLALAGLLLSMICVKSEESQSAVNILSTLVSVALVLMMPGIIVLALVPSFLR